MGQLLKNNQLIDKKVKKQREGKCYFCGEDDYDLLDCHRIVPGEEGGRYTEHNTVVVCCKCHRRIHAGQIEIKGKHFSTSGRYLIHYVEGEEEKWK